MAKKYFSWIFAIFFLVFFGLIICIPIAIRSSKFDFRIVIDAGHGFPDGGATGTKTQIPEADINLSIAKKLALLCKNNWIRPTLTRTTKDALVVFGNNFKKNDMQKRKKIIQNTSPHLVVSIHLNKFFDSSRKGSQVFFQKGNIQGKILADCIQKCLNQTNERNFSALSGDYYILNCTNYVGVIVECGFLSNPTDEQNLQKEEYQQLLAEKILQGIVAFLSLS